MTDAVEKLVEVVARAQFDAWVKALCPDWDFPFDGLSPLTSNGMTFREYHELQAKAAISAIEAAGWQIVPVESTQDMRNAGFMAMNQYGKRDMDKIYEAMLAAAPKVVP